MMETMLIQHMVNVEKANQELDITTMCHTENYEALKIFIVSSGKDIVALSLGANCSITGKGKSSNGVLFTDDKLPNFTFVLGQILTPNVVSTLSSARRMTSISPMGNQKSDTFDL